MGKTDYPYEGKASNAIKAVTSTHVMRPEECFNGA